MDKNPLLQTIVIDNFSGRLTHIVNGNLNSGLAKQNTTFGTEPFGQPGNLKWLEQPTSIGGSVVTDLIVAQRARIESGITYVYAIGHLGRLYKIQSNDTTNKVANYDNPVLVTTLTNSQTFTRGGSIEFYGSTEKIFIGHDTGVTKINFDGSGETVVGVASATQWIANTPRQSQQFNGKIYYTNSSNIAEIDSTELVTTYTKISPGFPTNVQARDINIDYQGRYVVIMVSRVPLASIIAITQDTNEINNSESYAFYWNGSDTASSSYTIYPSFAMTAYKTFGENSKTFGYDIAGGAVFDQLAKKELTMTFTESPLPNAIGENGNLIGWVAPLWDQGYLKAAFFLYGSLDREVDIGLYNQVRMAAAGAPVAVGGSATAGQGTDVVQCPSQCLVSNLGFGLSYNGYGSGVFGSGKFYFSTLESDGGSNTKYKLYKVITTPPSGGTMQLGVYETQTQLFSKKVKISEGRFYFEPAVANNSFKIDLIGSDGNSISDSSKTFSPAVGDDLALYSPSMNATYALGLRITNVGTASMIFHKAELDVVPGGK